YSLGMHGNVVCLDAVKGDLVWRKDLAKEYQLGEFPCPKASPLIEKDLLIIAIGGKPKACVIALDKHSGKEACQALDDSVTHSSPTGIARGRKPAAVCWDKETHLVICPRRGGHFLARALGEELVLGIIPPVLLRYLAADGGFVVAPRPRQPRRFGAVAENQGR